MLGVGCKGRKSPDDKKFYIGDDEDNFPAQFSVTLETVDLHEEETKKETHVHRHDVITNVRTIHNLTPSSIIL